MHNDKLPLIEVKEISWAEALLLLVRQPTDRGESFPYGKEALCSRSSGR